MFQCVPVSLYFDKVEISKLIFFHVLSRFLQAFVISLRRYIDMAQRENARRNGKISNSA